MITADDGRAVTETAAIAGAAAAAPEADAIEPRVDELTGEDVRSGQESATQEWATPEPTAPEPAIGSPAEQTAEMEGQAPAEFSQEVETDEVEVLAQTDATPASALPLDESVEPAAGRDERSAADAVPLSDSSFGRAMEELAADSGPIVEDPVARAPRAEPLENRAPTEARVNDDIALEMLSGASPAAGEGPAAAAPLELDTASAAETSAPEPEKLFNLPAGTEPSAPPVHPERSTPSATQDEVELALEPSAELKHAAPQDTRKPKAADRDRTAEPPRPVEPQREAPRSGASRYAPGSSQLDLEPVDESELRATAPDAGSDQADELALEAIAEAPTPTSAKTPPRGEGPATEEPSYNWGANQEHFLGGMPLKLGGDTAQSTPAGPLPRPTPATPATPAAPTAPARRTPAARAPLTDDSIGESSPAGRPAPGRQPQGLPPRPAPRRGGTFAGGRPLPFAGSDPAAPQVTTGFDGLAMPPVREADVFAPMQSGLTGGTAPGAMNDIFSQGARRGMPTPQPQPGGTSAPAGAPAAAPRRATRSQPPGDALTGAAALSSPGMATEPASGKTLRSAGGHQRPPATPAAPVQTEAPPRKKRRWFGLRMLLIALAVPSALAAGAAAYYLMPNRAAVRGVMKFENFQKLPQRDRVPLEGEQRELLADPSVRDAAQRKLAEIDASLSPGFLRGGVELARIRSEAKMDMESGTLTLPMAGAARGDETRMFALLQAMYDANGDRARKSVELAGALDNLKRQREQSTKKLEELKGRIDKLASVAQASPSAAERDKASAEVKRLQAEWNASDLAVAALTRELEQLQATPVAAATATPPAPADNAAADVGASAAEPDAELAALEKELADVRAEIASLQEADKGGLTAAGDRLESALGALAKRLEAAREGAGDSPAFAAYLEQATGVADRAREQTAEFVKRQSEQIARLVETEASLAQKKLARRAEVASRDPELATLLDQRDLKTRQYNAAQGDENLKAEAAEIKTELNFLQSMIAARQTRVADDGFNADAIDQLERIADATRREIEADRRESSEVISQLQAELAGGRADGFSPAQTESATSLESGLADLATARKQFVAASDAATLEEAQQSAGLQAKAMELSRTITARQAEVAAAQATAPAVQAGNTSAPQAADPAAEQAARVAAKSAELADAQQRHESAKKAYLAAQEKLATLTEQANRAREAGEERDRLALQRDAEQQTLKMNAAQFESRKKEAEMLAYPAIPAPGNVTASKHVDRRRVYSLAAFGGVAALFSLGILLTGGAREGSAPIDAPQDEESAASEPIVERPVDPQAAAESPAARVAEV